MFPELKTTKVKYKDIFGNINKMVKAAKLFTKVDEARKEILELITSCDDLKSFFHHKMTQCTK